MPSKILYNTRTLEILRCQPKPNGAELPSFDGLCRSARIPDSEREFMGTIVIDEEYLTSDAQKYFELVKNGDEVEVIRKSEHELELRKNNLQAPKAPKDEEIEKIKEDFIIALLEDDSAKVDELKTKYRQIAEKTKKTYNG